MSSKQKFHMGDLVQVAEDLGPSMAHFTSGCRAVVMGSYDDKFGGGDTDSYTLFLEGSGECSWYHECQLTLIESNRCDLLREWKDTKEKREAQESDLDWIFSGNVPTPDGIPGASVEALGKCLGVENLWGFNGEGMNWYANAMLIVRHARPFITAQDKEGWLKYCEDRAQKKDQRKNGGQGKA